MENRTVGEVGCVDAEEKVICYEGKGKVWETSVGFKR